MGIFYSAVIIVGLPQCEILNQDLIDADEIHVCPPFFDGGGEDHAIAGWTYIDSGDFRAEEINIDLDVIEALKYKFKKLTGQDAKVYLSPRGW